MSDVYKLDVTNKNHERKILVIMKIILGTRDLIGVAHKIMTFTPVKVKKVGVYER